MTCHTMLERMLDAEPGELLGRGETALAVHLRECSRCRAVAQQLLDETGALVNAMARDARLVATVAPPNAGRRRWTRQRALLGGLIAVAGIVVAAFLWSPPRGVQPGQTTATLAPAARPPAVVNGLPIGAERYPAARPILAEAVAATAVTTSPEPLAPARLIVRPPSGVRAAVLQTANPTITVVWLY